MGYFFAKFLVSVGALSGIKGLLFGQGIRGINVKARYKTLVPAKLILAVVSSRRISF